MCAINPVHKKRFIIDVYTSDSRMTKEEFQHKVILAALVMEQTFNQNAKFRWHVKESEEQAA